MSRVDLSKLPEPLRQKLQARLDQLPSDVRDKLLEGLGKVPPQMLEGLLDRGSPMLDKILNRLEKDSPSTSRSTTTSSSTTSGDSSARVTHSTQFGPAGHYSKTVQRGDNMSLRFVFVLAIVIAIVVMLYRSGLLPG